jgi:hypothetical protein
VESEKTPASALIGKWLILIKSIIFIKIILTANGKKVFASRRYPGCTPEISLFTFSKIIVGHDSNIFLLLILIHYTGKNITGSILTNSKNRKIVKADIKFNIISELRFKIRIPRFVQKRIVVFYVGI